MEIQKRKLGKTKVDVTLLGLGGEGVLRTFGHDDEACALINRALDLGINYFESARAYSGSESYYGKALRERRKKIFLTSKSHARDGKGALEHLQETLKNMKTDHLDLWQMHDMRTDDDVKEIFGPGGAIEAFAEAKQKGLTRFIGVTGHHNPEILKKCISLFDFDTVLLPVNPAEPHYKSFLDEVVPFAKQKGMGVIGMKVYFRGFAARIPWFKSMEPFLHFALSQPVSTVVIGCDSVRQLEENVAFALKFSQMPNAEMRDLIEKVRPFSRQLMYYKP
ncbi:MAG: aldo/keto reductase [Thermodesulfovibrionales bacterium]|jgi:aryl-alcohol dehydrogenase-like predicted oxidoreductase